MKKITIISVLMLLMAVRAVPEPQIPSPSGNPITLTSGTAVRFIPNPSTVSPVMCNSFLVQSLAGNTGIVYVLNANPAVTMVKDGAGTTTVAQLSFGTSTQPGSSFTFPSNGTATSQSSGADWRYWGIQGSTGDTVEATCDLR